MAVLPGSRRPMACLRCLSSPWRSTLRGESTPGWITRSLCSGRTGRWESLTPLNPPKKEGEVREKEEGGNKGGSGCGSRAVTAVSAGWAAYLRRYCGRGCLPARMGATPGLNTYAGYYMPDLTINPANPVQAVASLRDRLVRHSDGGHSCTRCGWPGRKVG